MYKAKKYVVAGLLLIVIVVFAYRYWTSSTALFDCDNETLREASSPDGKYVATVFERNCGATTPYHRIVALRQAGTKLNADKHEDWVFVIKEQSEVQLTWRDVHHLEVVSNGKDVGQGGPKFWKDVEISTKSSTP